MAVAGHGPALSVHLSRAEVLSRPSQPLGSASVVGVDGSGHRCRRRPPADRLPPGV